MRTDAKITRYGVRLPNIAAGSIRKKYAEPGDFIKWGEDGCYWYGRVIGRVDAPAMGGSPEVKNWLCVVRLCGNLDVMGEFWVNPADVVACDSDIKERIVRLQWLLGDDWDERPINDLRQCFDKSPWVKSEDWPNGRTPN